MNILFDENIPCGREAFATLGTARACAGRSLTSAALKDTDLLFVRSVTPVNAALLSGSRVRFVATATAGTDHVDQAYLTQAGIAFADALGSNANSVAEYVMSALCTIAERRSIELAGKTIGIVGVGHVGSLVAAKAPALGLRVLLNDPPRQRAEPDFRGVPLEEALAADIVTLHVPLTHDGLDATQHMLDAARLKTLKPGCILIQSCRGPVVDNRALKEMLRARHAPICVLDVWEGEPALDRELLALVDLATPHIAGYSWASKINGTAMVYAAACKFLGVAPAWQPPEMPAGVAAPVVALEVGRATQPAPSDTAISRAVRAVYDIAGDDARMRAAAAADTAGSAYFDALRKNYPLRFEFHQAQLSGTPPGVAQRLGTLGFRVE